MLNSVEYQGRLTAEPELKQAGGFPCLDFTVAWNETYKEKETTCFLRCKAWSGTAERIAKYWHKGEQIIIEGRLETDSWEKDGQKQSMIVCRVDKAHFCGSGSKKTVDGAIDEWMKVNDSSDDELPFH